MSLGRLVLPCGSIIIGGIGADIVVNIFEGVISCIAGLNRAASCGNAVIHSVALAVCSRIGFIRGNGDGRYIDCIRVVVIVNNRGGTEIVRMISDPENLRMIISKSDGTEIDALIKIDKSLIGSVNIYYLFTLGVHIAVVNALHPHRRIKIDCKWAVAGRRHKVSVKAVVNLLRDAAFGQLCAVTADVGCRGSVCVKSGGDARLNSKRKLVFNRKGFIGSNPFRWVAVLCAGVDKHGRRRKQCR